VCCEEEKDKIIPNKSHSVIFDRKIIIITTGKHDIFLGLYIFFDTEEYNYTIFLGTKTDKDTVNR
jgi:hypothetical protein